MAPRVPTLHFDHDIQIPFSVDGALLRELGDRLIGRPEIAMSEVIKNAYDADARLCEIIFAADHIEIVDDGDGMSQSDFLNFWMRIGSTHKGEAETSARQGRALTGQKGIGRLSVQFLGGALILESRSRSRSEPAIRASVDWSEAIQTRDLVDATVKVRLQADPPRFAGNSYHGTRLRVKKVRQDWQDAALLQKLAQQIWILQPPLAKGPQEEESEFRVEVVGLSEDAETVFKAQMNAALDLWRARIHGRIESGRANGSCRVVIEIREPELTGNDVEKFEQDFRFPTKLIDKASFEIRVFDLKHRQPHGISVSDARKYFEDFGGVHVVDAGFRLPYYGQKSSDWLELETDQARRSDLSKLLPDDLNISGAMLDLPRTRQLYGVVRVNTGREKNKAPNPDGDFLKISPGRDRLLDNDAFEALKNVVRQSIDYFATRRFVLKERAASAEARRKGDPVDRSENLRKYVQYVAPKLPKEVTKELLERVDATQESIDAQNEVSRQHRVMLGTLATAGMAALAIDHELRKELHRIRALIEKCERQFSSHPELSQLLTSLSEWASTTEESWKVFSPLMTEEGRQDKEHFRLKPVVDNAVRSSRRFLEGVRVTRADIPDDLTLPRATASTWHAILQNVFVNAVNAQVDAEDPLIRCSAKVSGNTARLYIQDRGVGLGVELEESSALFEPFERRLKLSPDRKALGLGGAGLGLTIVRMLAEVAKCVVYFAPPDEGFSTAFCMEWKLNARSNRR